MHFNILPGQHVIITAKHPNSKVPNRTFAALVALVEKDHLAYQTPYANGGITGIEKTNEGWFTRGGIVLSITGPNDEDLLASGFVTE